jgi:hypothetical protein
MLHAGKRRMLRNAKRNVARKAWTSRARPRLHELDSFSATEVLLMKQLVLRDSIVYDKKDGCMSHFSSVVVSAMCFTCLLLSPTTVPVPEQ